MRIRTSSTRNLFMFDDFIGGLKSKTGFSAFAATGPGIIKTWLQPLSFVIATPERKETQQTE